MKFLRGYEPPDDSNMAVKIDPLTTTTSRRWTRIVAVRFGNKFDAAIGALVAVVAASGWLYLIAKSVRAFVDWI
jgi:hypothetical protein